MRQRVVDGRRLTVSAHEGGVAATEEMNRKKNLADEEAWLVTEREALRLLRRPQQVKTRRGILVLVCLLL